MGITFLITKYCTYCNLDNINNHDDDSRDRVRRVVIIIGGFVALAEVRLGKHCPGGLALDTCQSRTRPSCRW